MIYCPELCLRIFVFRLLLIIILVKFMSDLISPRKSAKNQQTGAYEFK